MNRKLPKKKYRALARILNTMAALDQRVARGRVRSGAIGVDIFKIHTRRMRTLLDRHGWPLISMVGTRAHKSAWLLVQHADHNVKFQEYCLQLMRAAYALDPHSVAKEHLAHLTDRILVNRGKPQMFGTQFYVTRDGSYAPRPLRTKKGLDRLRRAYNLPPFSVYNKYITAAFRRSRMGR